MDRRTRAERKEQRKLRKAEKRRTRGNHYEGPNRSLSLLDLEPMTENQDKVFDAYYNGKNLMLHGSAGTGKTYISIFLALQEIMEPDSIYKKLIIVRSTQAVREEGFLPGSHKEKAAVYESPYQAICSKLFGRADAYSLLKHHGKVEFMSTAYVRGITLDDCIVLVDEIQNLNDHECNSIITRLGDNAKIIFCGDIRQSDLNKKARDVTGLKDFLQIIKRMSYFETIEFGTEDIVRGRMVKQYITTRNDLEEKGTIKSLA